PGPRGPVAGRTLPGQSPSRRWARGGLAPPSRFSRARRGHLEANEAASLAAKAPCSQRRCALRLGEARADGPCSRLAPLLQGERRSSRSLLSRRSEEHTSELQSRENLVCRLLLE